MNRAEPKSKELSEPVRKFEDTFSAEVLILNKFFKGNSDEQERNS